MATTVNNKRTFAKDIFERYEGMAQSSECKAQFQANIAKYKKIYLSGRKNKTEE